MRSFSVSVVLWCLLCTVHSFNKSSTDPEKTSSFDLILQANLELKPNPEYSSPPLPNNVFEGDISLTAKQKRNIDIYGSTVGRAASKDPTIRWPGGIIPYEIDCSLQKMHDALDAIKKAMQEWEASTCIRFVKRTNEKDYLWFFRQKGCWCNVGRIGGKTSLSVGDGCEFQHVMVHEIGHAVGFWHEQSRPDRDSYVRINKANILPGYDSAFAKYSRGKIDSMNIPYDYGSIMHYPFTAFSRNGKATLQPLRPLNGKSPYQRLSALDAQQTNLMYNNCRRQNEPRKRKNPKSKRKSRPKRAVCRNYRTDCRMLARRYRYCRSNPRYMWRWCRKACGFCRTTNSVCRDNNKFCNSWARRGECYRNPRYMRIYCKLSCRVCRPIRPKPPTPRPKPPTPRPKPPTPRPRPPTTRPRPPTTRTRPPTTRPRPPTTRPRPPTTRPRPPTTRPKPSTARPRPSTARPNPPTNPPRPPTAKPEPPKTTTKSPKKTTNTPKPSTNPPVPPTQPPIPPTPPPLPSTPSTPPLPPTPPPLPPSTPPLPPTPPPPPSTFPPVPPTLPPEPPTLPPTNRPVMQTIPANPVGIRCSDNHASCSTWASSGRCRTDSYVKKNCLKSCSSRHCDREPVRPVASCSDRLGLGWDYRLPDYAFTASSQLNLGTWDAGPRNARMYFIDDFTKKRAGGWCAASLKDQWLQIDLGTKKYVTAVGTQGRNKYFEHVKSYKLAYSVNGINWKYVTELDAITKLEKHKVFKGNCDHFTPVINRLPLAISARYIKFYPIKATWVCMRVEIYGCT